jgi:hypothetical protein
MKKFLSLFFVNFLSLFAFEIIAQSNFQKGYIISEAGDTTIGLIDYMQWDRNPKTLRFRTDSVTEPVNFSPLEIHAFVVNEDHYLGGIYEIDQSPYLTEDLTTENKAVPKIDTVFLTVLVEGTLSLFYLRDENAKEHFFIRKNDTQIKELIYRRYLLAQERNTLVESRTNVAENNMYRGVLIHYTSEIPGFIEMVNSARYKTTDLIKLVDEYNKKSGCESGYCRINKSRTKGIFSFHVLSGLAYSYYTLNNSISEGDGKLIDSDPNPSFTWFIGGIGLNMMLPRKLQRFSLYFESLYHVDKYTFNYHIEERLHLDHYYHTELIMHSLKFAVMPRYQPLFKNYRPYINAGFTLSAPFSWNYDSYKVTYFWDQESTHYYRGVAPAFGFDAGLGLYYRKFNFELRYSLCTAHSLYVLVSYRIKASTPDYKVSSGY